MHRNEAEVTARTHIEGMDELETLLEAAHYHTKKLKKIFKQLKKVTIEVSTDFEYED